MPRDLLNLRCRSVSMEMLILKSMEQGEESWAIRVLLMPFASHEYIRRSRDQRVGSGDVGRCEVQSK
jgi:hypothetical protein